MQFGIVTFKTLIVLHKRMKNFFDLVVLRPWCLTDMLLSGMGKLQGRACQSSSPVSEEPPDEHGPPATLTPKTPSGKACVSLRPPACVALQSATWLKTENQWEFGTELIKLLTEPRIQSGDPVLRSTRSKRF
jgi:hypothetical protein